MKLTNILRFTLVPLASFALVSCSNKPPSCSDAQTLETAKSMLVENIAKFVTGDEKPDDPDGWLQKFYDGMTVQISSVVSDGYKEDSKKQSCRGTMLVSAISGETAEREVEYSTQATQDKSGGFLLEIQNFKPFVQAMSGHAFKYYFANRWAGTWNGTYACNGINSATEGAQGPFSLPASMLVEGYKARLERTTIGGGVEKLAGEFDLTGMFMLQGEGVNSPDDRWNTAFKGNLVGKKVTAEGTIKMLDGTVLRQCQLSLNMQ